MADFTLNWGDIDWGVFYKELEAMTAALPASTPAPAPAPAPTSSGSLTRTEEAIFGMTNEQVTQAANIAEALTQAVIQSPPVVASPTNQAPSVEQVQIATQQVAAVLAPIIAPDLPKDAIQDIVNSVSTTVVQSPEVIATPANSTVTPDVASNIVEKVVEQVTPEEKPGPTPTPTPEPTPATTPVSTPTSEALSRTEESLFGMTDQQITEASELVKAITEEVVNSPAIVNTPAGSSPSLVEVEEAVKKVAEEVAPEIAPALTEQIVNSISDYIAATVVTSPEVTATPVGQTLNPEQTKALESDIVNAISGGTQEQAQQTLEKVKEVAKEPEVQTSFQTQYSSTPELTRTEEQTFGVTVGTGPSEIPPSTVVPTGPAVAGTEAPAGAITAPVSPVSGLQVPAGPTGPVGATGPFGPGTLPSGTLPPGTQPPSQTYVASDGTTFTNFKDYLEYQQFLAGSRKERQSAYDLIYEQFSQYGLGSLVEPLKALISDPSVSPSEFTIRLRQTDAYKTRFASNAKRIAKGLRAITEGEYLELEDRYQDIMRRYGLPQSYYTRGELGRQEGFEKFIEFDVSPVELEERISTAQNRISNAPPEVMRLMSDFYGDVISNGDALAYILDPQRALSEIQRRVTAAEIGAGAVQAGLTTTRQRAEELQRFGVTGEEARRGFQAVAEVAPRGGQLAAIYKEEPYTQQIAEAEVFGTPGAVEARKKRERLVGREQAEFAGRTGAFQGALARDRAGAY